MLVPADSFQQLALSETVEQLFRHIIGILSRSPSAARDRLLLQRCLQRSPRHHARSVHFCARCIFPLALSALSAYIHLIETGALPHIGEPEMTDTYTMHIETAAGIRQHPWHLGTLFEVAESFVLEALQRPGVMTIALRCGNELVGIYDWRALPGYDEEAA